MPPQLPDDSTESARVPALVGINSEPMDSSDEPNVMVIVHEASNPMDDSEMVSQSAPGSPSLQEPTEHHQSEYTEEEQFDTEPKDSGRSEAPEFSGGAPDYSVQVIRNNT